MSKEISLTVTEVQRFCMHDGPGLRTVVFLKGCPLRCEWCHNPETQKGHAELLYDFRKCIACGACLPLCPQKAHEFSPEHRFLRENCLACGRCAEGCPAEALTLCGTKFSVGELVCEIERDRPFYGSDGGVTLSGGEPFAQPEGALALLKACKEMGISTAAETCGSFDPSIIPEAVSVTDWFLFDVKDTDCERHRRYTGLGNEKILSNLRALDRAGAKIILRCILVKGVNDTEAHGRAVSALAESLQGCMGVEVLPYHAYGGSKQIPLGNSDNGRVDWIPLEEDVKKMERIINFPIKM